MRAPASPSLRLPGKLHTNLHLASAPGELFCVKELIGGDVGIGAAQGVIDCSEDHARLKYARLSQRVVAMIENIHRINADLKAKPFGDLGIFEYRHVPDVYPRSSEGVASQVGEGTHPRLHITGRGILSQVAGSVCTASWTAHAHRGEARSASSVDANEIHPGSRGPDSKRIEDCEVYGTVTIYIGVHARKDRDWLPGLRQIGTAPLPAVCQCSDETIVRAGLRKLIDPRQGHLVSNVQNRPSTVLPKVRPILGPARVDQAAEQLIRRIVNIARPRIVGAEHQAA